MLEVIQCIWIGTKLGTMEQLSLRSFLHHGHPVHLYAYNDLTGVPPGVQLMDANEILPEARIKKFNFLAQAADFFRLKLLYERGGWYSDTDAVCIRPFVFMNEHVYSSEYSADRRKTHVNNGNLRAPKGSPVLRWCLDQIEATDISKLVWSEIGPMLMKRAVERFHMERFVQPGHVFCPVQYQHVDRLINPLAANIWPNDTVAVHLYHAQWGRNKQDPEATYPPTSIYEQLKRQYLYPAPVNDVPKPSVSIVIPCFNQAQYLQQCIDSCLAQTYPHVEIIVVNDGSTDRTLEVARSYGNKIKLVDQSNKGLSGARNAGVMNSTGDLILPLDADDWIDPTYVAKTVPLMRPGVGVVSPLIAYFGERKSDWQPVAHTLAQLLDANYVSVCSLIRRQALLETGGWNPRMIYGMEDWNLWIDIEKRGWDFVVLPEPLFYYRTHKHSMTHDAARHGTECREMIRLLHPELYRAKQTLLTSLSGQAIPSRVLIAVLSCHGNAEARQAIRDTWGDDVHGADLRFFVGGSSKIAEPDCVYLNCPDDYKHLADKTRAMVTWAIVGGYTNIFKCDDDTYVCPARLLDSDFRDHHYIGFARPYYMQGGAGYWLSAKAMALINKHKEPTDDQMEDRWVGRIMRLHGVDGHHDPRYQPAQDRCPPLTRQNNLISTHKHTPQMMHKAHEIYRNSELQYQSVEAQGEKDSG